MPMNLVITPSGRSHVSSLTLTLLLLFVAILSCGSRILKGQAINVQQFDIPGSRATFVMGVNDSGAMVGLYLDSSLTRVSFVYSKGKTTPLYSMTPLAINNSEEVLLHDDQYLYGGGYYIYQNGNYATVDVSGYADVGGTFASFRI